MSVQPPNLNLEAHPNQAIAQAISKGASALLAPIKAAPAAWRRSFPIVLQTNHFTASTYVSKKYAFLAVESKATAQRTSLEDRLRSYRDLFVPADSNARAIFLASGRQSMIQGPRLIGPHALALPEDFSICLSDLKWQRTELSKEVSVPLLYIVGFGKAILAESCWAEFDALIRVTVAQWANPRTPPR